MTSALSSLIRRYSHLNWVLFDQAMVSGSNFLTGIILARALGIAEFGRFTLAWMVVLFVQSIQHAAINAPMMTIGARQESANCPAYYGAVFVQQIAFAILSAGLSLIAVTASALIFPDYGIAGLTLPLTAAVFFTQVQDFLRRYYFTIEKPVWSCVGDGCRYLGQIVVIIWLSFAVEGVLTSAMVLWILASSAMCSAVILLVGTDRLDWSGRSLGKTVSEHWHFGK